jgi:hypothetical protein
MPVLVACRHHQYGTKGNSINWKTWSTEPETYTYFAIHMYYSNPSTAKSGLNGKILVHPGF